MMSTLAFFDPGSSTQADEAQSSQVPVPLPEDPYEAIRQAYLDGTDTESKPIEDPVETETLESPLTVAPPTSLPESTPPTLVLFLCRTARMVVRVPPALSLGLSASMAEVAAMSESAFRKRFMSSYESSPSLSPPDLPLRKRYRGTSELVEDSEEDDDVEDEEIEESLDSDSVSEDAKDEGPTAEDEDHAVRDEGLAAGVEGPGMDYESHGLDDESHGLDDESRGLDDEGHSVESDGLGLEEEEEEAVPGVRLRLDRVLDLHQNPRDPRGCQHLNCSHSPHGHGMVYIDVPTYPPPAPPIQIPPSPEWTSDSLPISPSPSIVPLPVSSPTIPLTVPSPVATPSTVEIEGFLTKLKAQVEMQRGLIRDHAVRLEELSPTLFERSLEYEQERVAVTFRAIWRPMLALESWAGEDRSPKERYIVLIRASLRAQFYPCVSALRLVARDRADTHFLIRI
ncbi:hypothetical protein Tco_1060060 [Tanacetum coccineum]